MTGILIAFVVAALVPLFVATWRTSLTGLVVQGALIASLALRHRDVISFDGALALIDLVALRTVLAPALFYRAMRRRNAPPRNDVLAPNLVSWTMAIALVVMSFRAADALVPVEGDEQMLVAVSATGFSLGLFVLATSRGTFSQIIGIVRIENAIALFELGAGGGHDDSAIRVAMTAILLVSIFFYCWYLDHVRVEGNTSPVTDSAAL